MSYKCTSSAHNATIPVVQCTKVDKINSDVPQSLKNDTKCQQACGCIHIISLKCRFHCTGGGGEVGGVLTHIGRCVNTREVENKVATAAGEKGNSLN